MPGPGELMRAVIKRSVAVFRSPRVMQLEGLFDVPPTKRSEQEWTVELPIEERPWKIGLIVGPSGCGKSTILAELFGAPPEFDWPKGRACVDGFPKKLGIKQITGLLSSVGFSSPPSWLRPFSALSTGERFRVAVARALAEADETAVIDEFTSVVDRRAAKIGSAAVARAVRAAEGRRLVAATCHYDVVDWLQPDWTFEPATSGFAWRRLQRRPPIQVEVRRVHPSAWKLFSPHHYLDRGLARVAVKCFVGFIDEEPAVFTAVMSFCHPKASCWREHRTVCLPEFQGVGIGNAFSEFIAGVFRGTGKPYRSLTSSPAMISHRRRSPLWRLIQGPHFVRKNNGTTMGRAFGLKITRRHFDKSSARNRLISSFEYVGPADREAALAFGVLRDA